MGGPGSGSHYHWWRRGKKTTVEDCLSLDALRWTRKGILQAGTRQTGRWIWQYRGGRECCIGYEVEAGVAGLGYVRLSYTTDRGGGKESSTYVIRLTATRPRFGGLRWWFVCPLVVHGWPCELRVGKLCLPPGCRYFGCRTCYALTYTSSQQSHKYDRMYREMAGSLGWDLATVKWALNGIGKRNRS